MIALRHVLLPLAGLIGCAMVAYGGSLPDYWLNRSLPADMQPFYPLNNVLMLCAITGVECTLLLALLRPGSYRHSWGRAWCATLLTLLLAFVWGGGMMHAPPYYGQHMLWLLLLLAALLLLSLYSSVGAWRAALRQRKILQNS